MKPDRERPRRGTAINRPTRMLQHNDLAKIRDAIVTANTATTEAPVATASTGISAVDAGNAINPVNVSKVPAPTKDTTRPVPAPDEEPRSRSGLVAALMLAGLIGGGVTGWFLRPADLLAANARPGHSPPALWLAPELARRAPAGHGRGAISLRANPERCRHTRGGLARGARLFPSGQRLGGAGVYPARAQSISRS